MKSVDMRLVLPFHSIPDDRSGNEGDDMSEAEARVYD